MSLAVFYDISLTLRLVDAITVFLILFALHFHTHHIFHYTTLPYSIYLHKAPLTADITLGLSLNLHLYFPTSLVFFNLYPLNVDVFQIFPLVLISSHGYPVSSGHFNKIICPESRLSSQYLLFWQFRV